jgi:hypothetical protein
MVTRTMRLWQFSGALNTQLAPMLYGYGNPPAQKLQLAPPQCGYGNTMVTAIYWLWQYPGYGNTLAQKYAACWFASYIN